MLGNSKLLTMAAIGVIGVGAAMPYWSRHDPSGPLPSSAGNATVLPRVDAFIGQEQEVPQPEIELPAIRKVVSLGASTNGLDAAVPPPNLSGEYPAPISSNATAKQLVDLSPKGYQRVSIAQREPRLNSLEAIAIPVESSGEKAYDAPEPQPKTPRMSIGQRAEQAHWRPQTTTVVASKPVLPEPQPISIPAQTPLPERPAQPRRSHRLVDGDTLPKLAARYLGDEELAWAIFEANRDVLDDPQLLPLKVEIQIPAASEIGALGHGANLAKPTALRSLGAEGGRSRLRLAPLVPGRAN
ncbi:MAG: LysM peptidoglycan-binding domain-containing protein [Blastopirellula sp. JB062]